MNNKLIYFFNFIKLNNEDGGKKMTRVRRLKKQLIQTEQLYKEENDSTNIIMLSEKIKKLKNDLDEAIKEHERKKFDQETKDIQEIQQLTETQSKWKSIFTWTGISVITVVVAVGSYIVYDMLYSDSKEDETENTGNNEI